MDLIGQFIIFFPFAGDNVIPETKFYGTGDLSAVQFSQLMEYALDCFKVLPSICVLENMG
jgi:hypothetical protein